MRYLLLHLIVVSASYFSLLPMDAPPFLYHPYARIVSSSLPSQQHEHFLKADACIKAPYEYTVLQIAAQLQETRKIMLQSQINYRQLFYSQLHELHTIIQKMLHIRENISHFDSLNTQIHIEQLKPKERKFIQSIRKCFSKGKNKLKKGKIDFLHMAWKRLGKMIVSYGIDSKEATFLNKLRAVCAHRIYKELCIF